MTVVSETMLCMKPVCFYFYWAVLVAGQIQYSGSLPFGVNMKALSGEHGAQGSFTSVSWPREACMSHGLKGVQAYAHFFA